MNKHAKELMAAILACGAVAIALYFAFAGRSPPINLDTYEVLGAVTAEETAKLLGGKGQVLVMARDTGAAQNPSVEAELRAFQQALKKHRGLSVVKERIQGTPMLMMATGGGVASDQFFQVLRTHANLGAVVLFFGFPSLTDPEVEALKKSGVKVVVVSSLRPAYKRLLEQKAIQVVIAPRSDTSPPDPQTARTLRERFDQEYSIYTPAEAARLP